MPRYTCDPQAEVIGRSLLQTIACSCADAIRPLLQRHSLGDIDPERWYPLQTWLDVLSEISERSGSMFDLLAFGLAVADTTELPSSANNGTFEDLLPAIDAVYQMNHRGKVGNCFVEQVGDHHVQITLTAPYPSDQMCGVLYGLASRFLPSETPFTVQYDETVPKKEEGGEATVLHLMWASESVSTHVPMRSKELSMR